MLQSSAKISVSWVQLLHYTLRALSQGAPRIIWCGFRGQSRSSSVNSHTHVQVVVWAKSIFLSSQSCTCTTVSLCTACPIAKKNYHRSLALSARQHFFKFFSVICCSAPKWLSVSLFRNKSFSALLRSCHCYLHTSHSSCLSSTSDCFDLEWNISLYFYCDSWLHSYHMLQSWGASAGQETPQYHM